MGGSHGEYSVAELQFMQSMSQQVDTSRGNKYVLLDRSYDSMETPVFPRDNIQIIQDWHYWDGAMNGVCMVNNKDIFFFDANVESVWHHFSNTSTRNVARRWRIFSVYDCTIQHAHDQLEKFAKRGDEGNDPEFEPEYGDVIGIFF